MIYICIHYNMCFPTPMLESFRQENQTIFSKRRFSAYFCFTIFYYLCLVLFSYRLTAKRLFLNIDCLPNDI